MPYESPNIVIVPTATFINKKKVVNAQNKPSQSPQNTNIPHGANVTFDVSANMSQASKPSVPVSQSVKINQVSTEDVKSVSQDIITKPEVPQNGFISNACERDCNTVKKPSASWASSYLQSIGHCPKPIKLNLSSYKDKNMQINNPPENKCDQIKINLLSHLKVKKVNVKKISPTLIQNPASLNTGVSPFKNTRTLLTQASYPNTTHRADGNVKTNNSTENIERKKQSNYTKLNSDFSRSTIYKPCLDTKALLTQASYTNTNNNFNKNITNKMNSNIQRVTDKSHIQFLSESNLNKLIGNERTEIFNSVNIIHTSSNLQNVKPKLPNNNRVEIPMDRNINKSLKSCTDQEKCTSASKIKVPIKPKLVGSSDYSLKSKVSEKNIDKQKCGANLKETPTKSISINSKAKVEESIYFKKNLSSDKHINKETRKGECLKIKKAISGSTTKKLNSEKGQIKTPKPSTSGKVKDELYKKTDIDKVKLNSETKSEESFKMKIINKNEKKKGVSNKREKNIKLSPSPELRQRKRGCYNQDNENNVPSKIKKITQSSGSEAQQNRICGKPDKEISNLPNSKKNKHCNDIERKEKTRSYHNSVNENNDRLESIEPINQSSKRLQKKRVRRNSNPSPELPPKKRRPNTDSPNNAIRLKKLSPIKSVVQLPDKCQLKHPRIQAPDSDLSSEESLESDFDLRSRLSRKNYKHDSKINKTSYDNKDKTEKPRENLVITLNQNDSANKKQPKPQTSKPKTKTKKYKKIQLVINVICEKPEDTSDDSLSDSNNSRDVVNENYTERNLDLSFLDDFNIDEIVNSLKHSPKLDNIQQDNRQTLLTNNIEKKATKPKGKKFVQPIIIKSEIKTEYSETDTQPEILQNDSNCEVSQDNLRDSMIEDIGDIKTSNYKNTMLDSQCSENIVTNTVKRNENLVLIKNIKQEMQNNEEEENLNTDNQNTEMANENLQRVLLDDDVHHIANEKIDVMSQNIQSSIDIPCPVIKAVNDITREPCENVDGDKTNQKSDTKVLCLPDCEENVLEKVDSEVLIDLIDSEHKLIESNIVCAVPAAENTLDETNILEEKVRKENKNEIKTSNSEEIKTDKHNANEIVNVTETMDPKIIEKSTINKSNNTLSNSAENTTNSKNSIVPKNNKPDKITNSSLQADKVLAIKIKEKIFEYLHLDLNVTSLIHHGIFSKIFKCKDTNEQNYAIKLLKYESNGHSHGKQKQKMLKKLQTDIPKENLNTVYFINGFALNRHWCFLMEYYPKNLREALGEKKFHIDDVQKLSRQLVSAVVMLRNNNVVHSDIRPLHILLDASNQRLKVCGFDGSYYADKIVKVLPNIGTMSYRAPEIILGYSADFSIDVWATALVIIQMVTGSKLFHGSHNNEILYKQMSMLGNLPMDMVQNSPFAHKHFIGSIFMKRFGFRGQNAKLIQRFYGTNRLHGALFKSYSQFWGNIRTEPQIDEDLKKLRSLHKLLKQMLVLDPRRRLAIEFVFAHPFFK